MPNYKMGKRGRLTISAKRQYAYGRRKHLKVDVTVSRVPASTRTRKGKVAPSGHETFKACAKVGRSWESAACSYGNNPRKAVASALKFLGQVIGERKGAFRGMEPVATGFRRK